MSLVEGVSAIVANSRDGLHIGQETDAFTPYLYAALRLMGIADMESAYAEGLDMKPRDFDARPEHARKQMQALHT
ncbi:hypothetical protein DF030_32550 [Burkholderia cenocepacia]|nr:hypothetical protein DF030_32550 [Burkholderia cenocepacia]